MERDESEAIVDATEELLRAMLERNEVQSEDVVSVVFTATPDLTSEFPAPAARRLGLADVPLLCAAEIAVAGALPRCVRILLHVHTAKDRSSLRHVYLREATSLRSDLRAGPEAEGGEVVGKERGAGQGTHNPQGEVE